MSGEKKIGAMIGFIVLGMSPSFLDWQQSPDKHKQVLIFYALGLGLVYYGLLSG